MGIDKPPTDVGLNWAAYDRWSPAHEAHARGVHRASEIEHEAGGLQWTILTGVGALIVAAGARILALAGGPKVLLEDGDNTGLILGWGLIGVGGMVAVLVLLRLFRQFAAESRYRRSSYWIACRDQHLKSAEAPAGRVDG